MDSSNLPGPATGNWGEFLSKGIKLHQGFEPQTPFELLIVKIGQQMNEMRYSVNSNNF